MAQTLIHLSAPDNVRVNAEAPVELSFLALATCRRPQVQILLLRRPAESHNSARENNLTRQSKCHLRQRLRSSPAAHWGLDLLYAATAASCASAITTETPRPARSVDRSRLGSLLGPSAASSSATSVTASDDDTR